MAAFSGNLNSNSLYVGLYNAYKLVNEIADGLSGLEDEIVGKYAMDGGNYEDQIVFTDTDVLASRVFDPDDGNVLAPEMIADTKQQVITINKRRQIGLYNQAFRTKQAWMKADAFDAFNSSVQRQIGNTKKVYDLSKIFVAIGTHAGAGAQAVSIDVTTPTTGLTGSELSRVKTLTIGDGISNTMVKLKDFTRDFNNNGFLKSFDEGDFDIYVNAEIWSTLVKTGLPVIFNKDGVLQSVKPIPARFFGAPAAAGTADGSTHRAMEEYKIRVNAQGQYAANGTTIKNVFAGELLPAGTPIVAAGTAETTGSGAFSINGKSITVTYYSTVHAYAEDADKLGVIVHKNGLKYIRSWSINSSFNNDKNHSVNMYATWQFADPEFLDSYPAVSIDLV